MLKGLIKWFVVRKAILAGVGSALAALVAAGVVSQELADALGVVLAHVVEFFVSLFSSSPTHQTASWLVFPVLLG